MVTLSRRLTPLFEPTYYSLTANLVVWYEQSIIAHPDGQDLKRRHDVLELEGVVVRHPHRGLDLLVDLPVNLQHDIIQHKHNTNTTQYSSTQDGCESVKNNNTDVSHHL